MRLFLSSLVIALAASPLAAAPSLTAQLGRWVCLPDDRTAPQVLVDFEERVYRRCDQNTCTTYDILAVRPAGDALEIAFAPQAYMRVSDDGARYHERMTVGDTIVRTAGSCRFRGDAPDPGAVDDGRDQPHS